MSVHEKKMEHPLKMKLRPGQGTFAPEARP